jgi:hypothetical protein
MIVTSCPVSWIHLGTSSRVAMVSQSYPREPVNVFFIFYKSTLNYNLTKIVLFPDLYYTTYELLLVMFL